MSQMQGGYEDTQEVERLKEKARGTVKGAAVRTVKFAGKKAAQGAKAVAKKLLEGLIKLVAAHPVVALVIAGVIVLVLIVVCFIGPITEYLEAVHDKVLFPVTVEPTPYLNTEKFMDWAEYDDADYPEHAEGASSYSHYPGDPDHTDQVLAGIELAMEGSDPEAAEKFGFILTDQNLWHSEQDILDILNACSLKNMIMFEESKVKYEYHTWTRGMFPVDTDGDGTPDGSEWGWEEGLEVTSVMTDGIYGDEARIDIEGEEDSSGLHRFQMHWPEILSYFEIASWGMREYWGDNKDDYDPGDLFKPAENADDYYLTDEQIKEILKMFRYEFKFKYDSITDGADNLYLFKKLENGEYTIGYRFKKEEPDSILETTEPHEEYTWITRYVPEAAPETIENGWEKIDYAYTDIKNVPGYLPPGDTYKVPDGEYCSGRWIVVDPRGFIDTMSEFCPYYRANSDDYEWLDAHGIEYDEDLRNHTVSLETVNWVDKTIQHYLTYLGELPYASAEGRPGLFQQLADDYNNEVIRVSYEGTKTEKFGDYLNSLYEKYPECILVFPIADGKPDDGLYPEGWTTNIDDADLGTDEWYEVPDDLSGIPFHSYGVTFHNAGGYVPGEPTDPEDPYKPKPPTGSGDVYISEAWNNGHHLIVDDWAYLDEGAEADLCVNDGMSADQIKAMLHKTWGGYKVDTMEVAEALKGFQDAEGVSVAGLLAIMRTERAGRTIETGPGKYNNFFDISGEPHYPGTNRWRDFSMYSVAEAMTIQTGIIVRNYWKSTKYDPEGQNTFYRMGFPLYGYPQNWDEAKVAQARRAGHCYCPWEDNPAYYQAATTYPDNPAYPTHDTGASYNLWCNNCSRYRAEFLAAAGG